LVEQPKQSKEDEKMRKQAKDTADQPPKVVKVDLDDDVKVEEDHFEGTVSGDSSTVQSSSSKADTKEERARRRQEDKEKKKRLQLLENDDL
jgi:hypothetical protein